MTRRADRLSFLHDGPLRTAARLAETLEVSTRTIYHDIADLTASGVPIDAAAGAGYLLRQGYDLSPLMFAEAQSRRKARGWPRLGLAALAQGAHEALSRIEAVLPNAVPDERALGSLRVPEIEGGDRRRLDEIGAQAIAGRMLRTLRRTRTAARSGA